MIIWSATNNTCALGVAPITTAALLQPSASQPPLADHTAVCSHTYTHTIPLHET